MFVFLLIISIILLIAYLGAIIFQRSFSYRTKEIVNQKNKLSKINIKKSLLECRKLNLMGKSLNNYQNLEADYSNIENSQFANINELADSVYLDAKGINIVKTRNDFNNLRNTLNETKNKISRIQKSLSELKRVDKQHRQAVKDLRIRFDHLQKNIINNSNKYGPAYNGLEKIFSNLEKKFNRFADLTNKGDHTTASEVYKQLSLQTNNLEKKMVDLPYLYNLMLNRYPKNFQELQNGIDELIKRGYVFKTDPNVELNKIKRKYNLILNDFKKAHNKKIREEQSTLEVQIKNLYDSIENEYGAEYDIKENTPKLDKQIRQVRLQNQELTMEIDRLSKSFFLSHSEIEDTRGWDDQIQRVINQNEESKKRLKEQKSPFTSIRDVQENIFKDISQIAKSQKSLYLKLESYPKIFASLKKASLEYSGELSKIRYVLDQVGMPGLPPKYRLEYISVSDEIKSLGNMISSLKINLDDTQRQAQEINKDLTRLKSNSTDLYLNANLSVELIHYANRYINYPVISNALTRAKKYYERDFNYRETIKVVGKALDQIENGAYKRLRDNYVNRNQNPFN